MKTASFGQGLALAARVAECLPRDIPADELQVIIDDPDFWKEFLGGVREAYATHIQTIPDVNVEFELTLEPITGLSMVKNNDYNPAHWKFSGSEVTEPCTSRFKLVQVGFSFNLDMVRQRLTEHGKVPQGQWRDAFKTQFTKPDGKGPIGVADPSWTVPAGDRFPFINSRGTSSFHTTDTEFGQMWRWLVQVV